MRVCQRPFDFDGEPPEEFSESFREWPTWKSAARPPKTPRFFVGESRIEYEVGMCCGSFGAFLDARTENEIWRDGAEDCGGTVCALSLPLLNRGFSCTSTWPPSSSTLLPPTSSSTMVSGWAVPFGTTNSEMACAGGICRVYGFGGVETGVEEARHVGSASVPGVDMWPICEAD